MAARGAEGGGGPNQNQLRDASLKYFREGLKRLKDRIQYDFQESPMHNDSKYIERSFADHFVRLTNDGRTLFFSHDMEAHRFTRNIFSIRLADENNLGHLEERHVKPRQTEVFERVYEDNANIRTNSRFFGKLDAFVGIFISLVRLCKDIADTRERFTRRRQQQRQLLAEARTQLAGLTLEFEQRTKELDDLEAELRNTQDQELREPLILQLERLNGEWKDIKTKLEELPQTIRELEQTVRERFNYQGLTDLESLFIGYCYCRSRDRVAVRLMCSAVRIFIQEDFASHRPYIQTAYPDSILKDRILDRRHNSYVISLLIERHTRTLEEYQHAVVMKIPGTFENKRMWEIYHDLRGIPGCIIEDAWQELRQAIRSVDEAGITVDPLPIDALDSLRLMGESPAIEILKKESSAANYKRDETVKLYNALTSPPTVEQTQDRDAAVSKATKLNTELQDARAAFVDDVRLKLGQITGHRTQDRELLHQVMLTAADNCQCIRGGPIHRGPRPDRTIPITEPVTPQTTEVPRQVVPEEAPGASYKAAVLDDEEREQMFHSHDMNARVATTKMATMTSKEEQQEEQHANTSSTRSREE